MKNLPQPRALGRCFVLGLAGLMVVLGFAPSVLAQDLAGIVAKARGEVENGAYPEALRTLSGLPKDLPAALAVEAGLLEATAALVTRGEGAGAASCAKAVIAAGYDPDLARDQSPKVRAACRIASDKVRKERLEKANVKLSELAVAAPTVAWQPVRVSASVTSTPPWLRVVARVKSSELEGSFDLPLAPSPDGPLRGTIDPSFVRPRSKLSLSIVAQDKFGDLASTDLQHELTVPEAEAMVSLGDVPSAARVLIDGNPMEPDDDGFVAVEPGKHTVEMQMDGATSSAKVEVERGNIARVALSPSKGGARTLAWIATGSAVVMGAVGGVLLVNAAVRSDEIEQAAARREPGTSLPLTSYEDIKKLDDERKLFSSVGTGLAIAGGAVGALAITLWLLPSGKGKAPAKQGLSAPVLVPLVGLGTFGLSGTF